jgi:hypothetical protein
MKNDSIYPYYINYLDNRLLDGKITKGSYSLLRISESAFEDFKFKFENDSEMRISFIRDKKIDDLFDDII